MVVAIVMADITAVDITADTEFRLVAAMAPPHLRRPAPELAVPPVGP